MKNRCISLCRTVRLIQFPISDVRLSHGPGDASTRRFIPGSTCQSFSISITIERWSWTDPCKTTVVRWTKEKTCRCLAIHLAVNFFVIVVVDLDFGTGIADDRDLVLSSSDYFRSRPRSNVTTTLLPRSASIRLVRPIRRLGLYLQS